MRQDQGSALRHDVPGMVVAFAAPGPDGAGACRDRRRACGDRRERVFWSLLHGGIRPRRRAGRRLQDHHRPLVDWHGELLLTSAIVVLLLCVADALLTLQLLTDGASEVNPFMALLVQRGALSFAIVKLSLTGAGVLALVSIARFRVFRQLRVAMFVHAAMFGYAALVGYELWMLSHPG